jgi:hypothetical protein
MDITLKDMLLVVTGLIIGIPLAILANLSTPGTASLFQRWSLSTKGKKLAQLKREYEYINMIKESPTTAVMVFFGQLTAGLLGIGFVILSAGIHVWVTLAGPPAYWWTLFNVMTILLVGMWGMWQFMSLLRDIARATSFQKYTKEMIEQIQKLGGIRRSS